MSAPGLRAAALQRSAAQGALPLRKAPLAPGFAALLAKAQTKPTQARTALPSPTMNRLALPSPIRDAVSSLAPMPGNVPFGELVQNAARKAGVDPALVAAVAKAESSFNPRAQSGAGAKGLMQLMDATAKRLGVTDSFDPAQSLDAGARFLGDLLKQFNGDVRLALAAYNAGPAAVQKYGGIPPYQETQRYIPKVLAFVDDFRRISADSSRASEVS